MHQNCGRSPNPSEVLSRRPENLNFHLSVCFFNADKSPSACQMTASARKAFISHASKDKERFVLGFATKLREKGIDAWLDRWEIKPGDSLVEKIFEEGIKNANAFLVVLSFNSISKPWVREELDSGVVRKIEKSCRLIPILIDDCEVPQALKHLKWVRI